MELTVTHLSKHFGKKCAVKDVSFTLKSGIYGLLGPNGAGKTTLMKMLVNILDPTSGEVTLDGVDIRELGASYRDKLGYMPQEIGVYKNFSARRFLRYIAALKGITGKAADEKSKRCYHLWDCLIPQTNVLAGFQAACFGESASRSRSSMTRKS